MLASINADKTLFKHLVKKIEAEKSELLNSINREITRKRNVWHKNPSVYLLYRIQSDKLYTEYWNKSSIARELHFSPTTDMLVFSIPAKNHQALSTNQFEKIISEHFSRINKILLSSESVTIPDKITSTYFDSAKFNSNYADLASSLRDIADLLVTYQLSIFDVDSKTAIMALLLWLDDNFFCLDDTKEIIKPLLTQMQLICLKSLSNWSTEFIKNLSVILNSEFNQLLGLANEFADDVRNIKALLSNTLSLKKAESVIETSSQS